MTGPRAGGAGRASRPPSRAAGRGGRRRSPARGPGDRPGASRSTTGPRRRDIQGNIVPGFNKDHQHFLFLRIRDREPARRWVAGSRRRSPRWTRRWTSSASHRARRLAEGVREPPGWAPTWVNIAFSHAGDRGCSPAPTRPTRFGEQSFRQGLAARSTYLGDPTSPAHPGHRDHWLVGGPGNEADVLVIVAGGRAADSTAGSRRSATGRDGSTSLFEQRGDALPGALRGHEHFGFKDGVSQPGVRGRLSEAPGDFITPRHLDPAGDRRATPTSARSCSASPASSCVWPGQFLLGEPRQHTEDLFGARPAAGPAVPGVGAARLVPRVPAAAAGRRRRSGTSPPRPPRAPALDPVHLGVDAGRALAERGAADAGRRPPTTPPWPATSSPTTTSSSTTTPARSPLRPIPGYPATATRRPRPTCSARSARTSPTSARPTRATSPPSSASRTTACCG